MIMRKANIILPLLVAAPVLGGGNTVQGVGKDMKQGGEAIERASKK